MAHRRKSELAKEEDEVKKMIKKMNKEGRNIDEIDEVLVYGMGFSPEYSWKMIKETLKLKG